MRRGFFLILCMFTLCVATEFVNALPLFAGAKTITQYSPDQVAGALNTSDLVNRWDPPESGALFGDVKGGIMNLKRLNLFLNSFPLILASIGLPKFVGDSIIIIWNFIWWLSILDLIMGGKIFGT